MLHTIIDYNDIFCENRIINNTAAFSTNPYDYIRKGYFLDIPSPLGGYNNVSINCLDSGNFAGSFHNIPDKPNCP